jgi:hypothetical protein
LPTYMVERYLPSPTSERLTRDVDRATEAADHMTTEGTAVRYLRSTYLPQDDMCFYLFEAPSARAVAETMERAGIACERITEAIHVPAEGLVSGRGGDGDE